MINNLELERFTNAVCQIARQAGAYIREERSKFSLDRVERKHAHDDVSYVDKGSEQLIVNELRKLLPEADFITEEGTAKRAAAPLCWVVDPLDGTTNFIHQYAPYAVSIALLQGKEVLIGVVYEICSDECFYAWKDGGAYVNGRQLHVSTQQLEDPCCACSCLTTAMPTNPPSSDSSTSSTATLAASEPVVPQPSHSATLQQAVSMAMPSSI